MPVAQDDDGDAGHGGDDVEEGHLAGRSEGDQEEAQHHRQPLGHIQEGVLDRTEHAKNDRHADDIVKSMENSTGQ